MHLYLLKPGLSPILICTETRYRADVRVAVHLNVVPGTLDSNVIFVESPEQMDLDNGLFVTCGFGVNVTKTVSLPEQPLEPVTVTLKITGCFCMIDLSVCDVE